VTPYSGMLNTVQILHHPSPFPLECGVVLSELEIAYQTFGKRNAGDDNIIWVCHAFSGNTDPTDWWSGLIGKGKLLDPEHYYIVCANMLGSCYGTTGPTSIHPDTKLPYLHTFPLITIRDMVEAYQVLQQHLGIKRIRLIIGGSMGGQQALEWAIVAPTLFEQVCIIASNARHSPWGIAFNESQRMAIFADNTLYDNTSEAGKKGLEAARAIAMISYRHFHSYNATQQDEFDLLDGFRASSYQRYQGYKMWKRFNVFSYIALSKAMDTHHVGRNRGGLHQALQKVTAPTLVIGIQSDILFPIEEQKFQARHIPNASIEIIQSIYGHDAFLIEYDQLTKYLGHFLKEGIKQRHYINSTIPIGMPGSEPF